jgi:hypothetical protein
MMRSTETRRDMPAKVLILAFDALEETLVDRWAAEGHLPTFAKLGGRAATHRSTTPSPTCLTRSGQS